MDVLPHVAADHAPQDGSSERWRFLEDLTRGTTVKDIESSIRNTGKLRFIEAKGRIAGARTVTIISGEIRTALNTPDDFIWRLS